MAEYTLVDNAVGAVLPALTSISQRSGPSKGDWETRKLQIIHMYRDQDLTLKEVVGIMKEHGFSAT